MSRRSTPSAAARYDLYAPDEIAGAAGVPVERVRELVESGQTVSFRGFVAPQDALDLIRSLTSNNPTGRSERAPLTLVSARPRRSGAALTASFLAHGLALILVLGAAALGILAPTDTEETVVLPAPAVRLVYLTIPGPGGGGGGGGLQMPAPPPPAQQRAPDPPKRQLASPVVVVRRPPVRPMPRPPRFVPPRRYDIPRPVDLPQPAEAPAVVAPVVPLKANAADAAGLLIAAPSASLSSGTGRDGGVGSGIGTGLGEGSGAGLGPGSGGGTGGGTFRPGSGVVAPVLLREVRPVYTEEARKRSVEGDVLLEVVVMTDGRVGSVRVVRGLGAGLEQKAIEAVRQWRFRPAERHGVPVDVLAQVSVAFKLR